MHYVGRNSSMENVCNTTNDLHLVFVEFQAITGYPDAKPFKAADEALSCFLIQLLYSCVSSAYA